MSAVHWMLSPVACAMSVCACLYDSEVLFSSSSGIHRLEFILYFFFNFSYFFFGEYRFLKAVHCPWVTLGSVDERERSRLRSSHKVKYSSSGKEHDERITEVEAKANLGVATPTI
ncbi:uncharacterized protein LOC112693481 [Sipha flava]|uniref:Uncharacterized protein LOC112693481 n=1 Tax=Sipha flava TaxID=143950 RepID=A0A2S2R112_9HEMI|nr:uncharacterized protein LOC112693481 [Sipha flava]